MFGCRSVPLVLCLALLASPIGALAQTGERSDAFERAEAFYRGEGAARDLDQALALFEEIAAAGGVNAMIRAGTIHQMQGNNAKAIAYLEQAAGLGRSYAANQLAEGHANGAFGALSDPAKGVPELERLAKIEGNDTALYFLARIYERGGPLAADPAKAFEMYESLAGRGYVRAYRSLARMYEGGTGVEVDSEKALEFYRLAAEAGSPASIRDLGALLIESGQSEEARAVLQEAVDSGVPGAAAEMYNAHYRELFGAASRKAYGERGLKQLAEDGDVPAMLYVIRHHERKSRRIMSLDLDKVLANLNAEAEQGKGAAARGLARAYRTLRWLIPNSRKKHAALVRDHGDIMGASSQASEQVYSLYDPNDHSGSRQRVAEYLETQEGAAYVSGALRLRQIEQTAYVYFLQRELKALGGYDGPINGRATRPAMQAMLAFCTSAEIYDKCIHGPLVYGTSVEVLEALAARKAGS